MAYYNILYSVIFMNKLKKISLNLIGLTILVILPNTIISQIKLKPYFNKTLNMFYFSSDGGYSNNTKFYDYAEPFQDNYAVVRIQNKWEVIDTNLNTAFQTNYSEISSFNKGYSKVWNEFGQCNLINQYGTLLFKNYVDEVSTICNNKIAFSSNGLWGFANDSGNQIIKPQFNEVIDFKNGKTWAKKDSLWFMIDKDGNKIFEEEFEQVSPIENEISVGYRSQTISIINMANNQITEIMNIAKMKDISCKKITINESYYLISFSNDEYVAINDSKIIWNKKFKNLKSNGGSTIAIQQNNSYQLFDLNLNKLSESTFEDLDFYPNGLIKIYIGQYYYFKTAEGTDLIR